MFVQDDRAHGAEIRIRYSSRCNRTGIGRPFFHQRLSPGFGHEPERIGRLQPVRHGEPVGAVAVQQHVRGFLHHGAGRRNRIADARASCDGAGSLVLAAHDGRVVADIAGSIEHGPASRVE